MIPDSALRDEGTSYHYLPPTRYLELDLDVVAKLETVLKRHDIEYEVGRTWTTDALFRETRGKIRQRIAEGCLTVEMECSALAAVARFHGFKFGQYLEAADDVCGRQWDRREVSCGTRLDFKERVFWLSVEAVLDL